MILYECLDKMFEDFLAIFVLCVVRSQSLTSRHYSYDVEVLWLDVKFVIFNYDPGLKSRFIIYDWGTELCNVSTTRRHQL